MNRNINEYYQWILTSRNKLDFFNHHLSDEIKNTSWEDVRNIINVSKCTYNTLCAHIFVQRGRKPY